MRRARRPFLSLLLCLTLAVNLLATAASAHPLFIEICSGDRTYLVPSPDAPDPADCETCVFCCAVGIAPETQTFPSLQVSAVVPRIRVESGQYAMPLPRRNARAPPFLSI